MLFIIKWLRFTCQLQLTAGELSLRLKSRNALRRSRGFLQKNQPEQNSENRELGWNEKERAGVLKSLAEEPSKQGLESGG